MTDDFIFPGSIDEAKADGWTIIDIRRPDEWAERPLPQADKEIEMDDLAGDPAAFVAPDESVLLVCKAGVRAIKTAQYLRALGFDRVYAFPSAW